MHEELKRKIYIIDEMGHRFLVSANNYVPLPDGRFITTEPSEEVWGSVVPGSFFLQMAEPCFVQFLQSR